MEKTLVNPVAVQEALVRVGDVGARVLDISFIRVVTSREAALEERLASEPAEMEFFLERLHFKAQVQLHSVGADWLRLSFSKLVPSAKASLRSFLSPKKVGESLIGDWNTDRVRHYHGLNESELWCDQRGNLLFTYLDPDNTEKQFVFHLCMEPSLVRVGVLPRPGYMALQEIGLELPIEALSDRDVYRKLGECRDVVTNFRPGGQLEYHLKQRLLKAISESLYSTSRRVDFTPVRMHRVATSTLSPQ